MTEITLSQTVGQLRRIADQERFVAEHVGQPGCLRRREAADNVIALESAINLLSKLSAE